MNGSAGASRLFASGGEMGRLMAAVSWSDTVVGPVDAWPRSLLGALGICLASRFPMIIFWGPELALFYNDAYRQILGDKHPAALGAPARTVWSEIWTDIGPLLDAAYRGEATFSNDLRLVMQRYGYREETYFTFSYSPIPDERGTTAGVFCAVTETTDRVLTERRLDALRSLGTAQAEARTVDDACQLAADTLAGHAADLPYTLIYLVDDDDRSVRLAASGVVPPGERISPKSLPLDASGAGAPLRQAARTGRPVEVALPPEDVAGLARWRIDPPERALVLPLPQSGGTGTAGFLVAGVNPNRAFDDRYRAFLDLVASRIAAAIGDAEAYEAERRRAEALAEIDRAKTEFFANISHEFRTPLTLLLGPLEDLLMSPAAVAAGQRPLVESAHRNALRLLKLVNTLLDFSRVEAGRIYARYEPVDLAGHTADLVSAFRAATERAGLRLTVDCRPLPEPVFVDLDMWDKIVFNLVSNAFKFTLQGEIMVEVRANGDYAELSVRDTGVGIAVEELPRLFDRFHRVPGARARTHEGTGIGLSLVRELTILHGGAVEVSSAPDTGATFTVCLPFGSAHLPADRLADVAAGPESGRTAGPDSARMGADPYVTEALRWLPDDATATGAGSTGGGGDTRTGDAEPVVAEVLVVDDNADMRDYLRRILAPHWRVRTASDGARALEQIARSRPDLVLTDVMMPIVDGIELVRRLRADEATRDLPVVMVSARAGQEATIDGLATGANDYLIKPFTAQELLVRVRGQIETARLRRVYTDQLHRIMDAGTALTESVPTGETGRVLAELLIAEAASWTAIWLVHPDLDGQERVALHLAAAASPELAVALHDEPELASLLAVEHVIGSGRRAAPLEPPEWPDELRVLTRRRHVVTLPLTARGGTFGAVTLAVADGEVERLPYLEEIVRRGAMVMDNSRLFQFERRAAVSLQRSLLPGRLPALPGATVTARYLPGAENAEAGGDWYDVFALPGGRYALTVGDVMGRGMQAAALMGQVRSALRSYALEGTAPDLVLHRVDGYLAALDSPRLTTCLYAVYEPATCRLRMVSAGHPPPLLIPPAGAAPSAGAEYLPLEPGLPLGLGVGPVAARELQVEVEPGSHLLMFTDGLVETHDLPVGAGLDRLRMAFPRPPATPSEACDDALAALGHVVDEGVAGGHDDIALLAVRVDG